MNELGRMGVDIELRPFLFQTLYYPFNNELSRLACLPVCRLREINKPLGPELSLSAFALIYLHTSFIDIKSCIK
jgi:hypothetical protein